MTHQRVKRQRGPKPVPVEVKRCKTCGETKPLAAFDVRAKGGQGVAANCKACVQTKYETGEFTCSRCHRTMPGSAFNRAMGGNTVMQPCKECRSTAKQAKTRLSRIERGRAPYHLLSEVDEEAKTAICRECGPTHIYATGSKQGNGWRCGARSDEVSADWYDQKADIVDKHASEKWHRLVEVRGEEMRGTCTICGPDVPVRWNQSGGYFVCKSPTRKRKHADNQRHYRRLKAYGITSDQYEEMKERQKGLCAICGSEAVVRKDSDGELVVDHDHETGEVRGLLCTLCNTGLGAFRDSPPLMLAAIEYLRLTSDGAGSAKPADDGGDISGLAE